MFEAKIVMEYLAYNWRTYDIHTIVKMWNKQKLDNLHWLYERVLLYLVILIDNKVAYNWIVWKCFLNIFNINSCKLKFYFLVNGKGSNKD